MLSIVLILPLYVSIYMIVDKMLNRCQNPHSCTFVNIPYCQILCTLYRQDMITKCTLVIPKREIFPDNFMSRSTHKNKHVHT